MVHKESIYLLWPALRDAGDLWIAIGTMWWRLFPWERWMWCRLSTDSDPATNPRASAVIHKAKWASGAEFQCKGSATGRRGDTCVLQPPNIVPSGRVRLQMRGGTSASLKAP